MNFAIWFSNRLFVVEGIVTEVVVFGIVVAGMSAEVEAAGGCELQLPSRINPAISGSLTRGLF
jgi:hypothetical protein|tara:strand:- start:24 stop:212 length:189 start_codon:yes stop_codon:yes gene_type:complete